MTYFLLIFLPVSTIQSSNFAAPQQLLPVLLNFVLPFVHFALIRGQKLQIAPAFMILSIRILVLERQQRESGRSLCGISQYRYGIVGVCQVGDLLIILVQFWLLLDQRCKHGEICGFDILQKCIHVLFRVFLPIRIFRISLLPQFIAAE